jgi:hypothetical protein
MTDYQYVTQTGVIVPDTADILAEIEANYRSVFGADLSVAPETPQGILIAAEAVARAEVVRNNAALANQINPNLAGGVFLQAIAALTGLAPAPATPSVIPGVTLAGVAGTNIPAGVQARTVAGDIFESVSTVTLGVGGTATVDFQSVETGPIPASIGALTVIVTDILGWETVTNATAATLGTIEQSDESFRALRRNTLALQGVSLAEAITSALYVTEGVKSLQFRENVANTTETIDGVEMIPHSIWACVDGGTDLDVATTLLNGKSMGAGWNGDVEVEVTEPASGQVYPVHFDRPTPVPILVRATVRVGSGVVNPTLAVQEAILAYAAGDIDGEEGFTVGAGVSPFEIASAVNVEIEGTYVRLMEVATVASGVYQTTEIPLEIFEQATLLIGGITVIVL